MPERTHGKVTLWPVAGGNPIERWPVDARMMVKCGEFTTQAPGGEGGQDDDLSAGGGLPGGFTVEKSGTWYTLIAPDGKKYGKASRSHEEAVAQIPVTEIGAPAVVVDSSTAGASKAVELPTER